MKRNHSDFLDDTLEIIKQEQEDGEDLVNFNKVFLNSEFEQETNFEIKEENLSENGSSCEEQAQTHSTSYTPSEVNLESLSTLDSESRRNLKTFNFLKYILIKKQLKIKELIEQIRISSMQK